MFKWPDIIQKKKNCLCFSVMAIILQSHKDEYVVREAHTTVKDSLNKRKLDVEAINFYTHKATLESS